MADKKKSKTWRITDFDISEERKQYYRDLDKTRMAMGIETCPKTQKQHLQIFISFNRTYSVASMKKQMGKAHIEIALVSDWNYELKDGKYELDDRRQQGKRKDIAIVKDILSKGGGMRDLIDEVSYQGARHAELYLKYKEKSRDFQPNVYWLYGSTGMGKTKHVYSNHKWDDVFKPINFKWWEGYDAHPVVIIDDFRKDWCKFHELLTLLDRYPYRVETKGGSRQLLAKHMYITCPVSPSDLYGNRSDEDLNQLLRRITIIKDIGTGTEVKKGNTSFLDNLSEEFPITLEGNKMGTEVKKYKIGGYDPTSFS